MARKLKKLHRKEPILQKKQKYCVIIESGHGLSLLGFHDPGVTFKGDTGVMKERDYSVLIGSAIEKGLQGHIDNIITVGTYTNAKVSKKIEYANKVIKEMNSKDIICLYVSIHVNGAVDTSANGYEVWLEKNNVFGGTSQNLAVQILHMASLTGLHNRGIKDETNKSRSYMREINCPAVLVECGFMSNKFDRKFLYEKWFLWADYISSSILTYIKVHS